MNISEFLNIVISHIGSKEAKSYVEKELSQHLQQAKNAWMKKGYSEQEAEQKAVEEMGSPTALAQSMASIHKPKVDWLLIGMLLVACVCSFLPLLVLNEGSVDIQFDIGSMVIKNVLIIVAGIAFAIGCMYFDYRKLKMKGYLFYGLALTFIFAFPLLTTNYVNGQAIIQWGIINLQPWMALPLFVIAWASIFNLPTIKLWKVIVLFIVSVICYLNIAPISVVFLYIPLVSVMFLQSKFSVKEKWIVSLSFMTLVGIGIAFIVSTVQHYQIERLVGFFNPESSAEGSGYIYLLLRDVVSGAQWFGASTTSYLPDGHTNLVLAQIIQAYGYALAMLIVAILIIVMIRLIFITLNIKDSFGKLLVVGGITLFATQFMYHILMTFGLAPITSMSLPFISYGFMPTLLGALAVGLALSVYRRKNLYVDVK